MPAYHQLFLLKYSHLPQKFYLVLFDWKAYGLQKILEKFTKILSLITYKLSYTKFTKNHKKNLEKSEKSGKS